MNNQDRWDYANWNNHFRKYSRCSRSDFGNTFIIRNLKTDTQNLCMWEVLMSGIEDWLKNLTEADTTEDRTAYVRETPDFQRRVDHEVVERTSFQKGYPETAREILLRRPLDCGHHVNDANSFGGYCQGPGHDSPQLCGREYCTACAVRCPKCGLSVSAHCCAAEFEDQFYCRDCAKKLRRRRTAKWLWDAVCHPFIEEENNGQ